MFDVISLRRQLKRFFTTTMNLICPCQLTNILMKLLMLSKVNFDNLENMISPENLVLDNP